MVWRRTIRRVLVNDSWSGSRSWATAVSCMRPAGRRGPAGAPRPPGGRRRGLGAPHRPRAALVDLEFVQGGLDRPALVVQASQLDRGSGLGVQGRGDEPVQDRLAAGGGAAVGAVPAARLAALVVQASSSTPTRTGSPFPAVSRASQDPSARTRSAANPGPVGPVLTRHTSAAPRGAARRQRSALHRPRSASTSSSGPSRPGTSSSWSANAPAPVVQGPSTAATTAWCRTRPTRPAGAGEPTPPSPRLLPGRPNTPALAGLSATSRQVPSRRITRQPRENAPPVPWLPGDGRPARTAPPTARVPAGRTLG
jgi:hypothetical protein